ncbi:hypothetical protein Ddc_02600 [Ditylenchus destructor]|nr:hypothetical protein Ddc_02600 [Ditylenchus destructor]
MGRKRRGCRAVKTGGDCRAPIACLLMIYSVETIVKDGAKGPEVDSGEGAEESDTIAPVGESSMFWADVPSSKPQPTISVPPMPPPNPPSSCEGAA